MMPFGHKNASATYQRMATALLHNMMNNEVKVYVDDIVRISALKSYCMMLCMLLCMTLCMT